jgi:hypothetical protein
MARPDPWDDRVVEPSASPEERSPRRGWRRRASAWDGERTAAAAFADDRDSRTGWAGHANEIGYAIALLGPAC